jgi:squalene-associated FAD-dependent desaturase
MSAPQVHVVGAGLAGLAAAVRLRSAGLAVRLYESAPQPGGRCRSYFEPALGLTIDNGNHLILSGNSATVEFTRAVGAEGRLWAPPETLFDFMDLASGERWQLRPNAGRFAWWLLDRRRRAPGTGVLDHLEALRLVVASPGQTVGRLLSPDSPAFARLWHPLLLAALNTEPVRGTARLAGAVLRETLMRGGRAYRPLVAVDGLSPALVDPAVAWLAGQGVPLETARLRAIGFEGGRASALDFGAGPQPLGPDDRVVLAVPPWVAAELVPGLVVPDEHRAIVNGHFAVAPPPGLPRLTGLLGGTAEWLFAFDGRLSVTVSAADRLLPLEREELARLLWRDVARCAGLPEAPLPPWQIVKEKRATFAALPEQERRRPGPRTRWHNLLLAGDWTATGLPATIEGAIRSGNRAADLIRPV